MLIHKESYAPALRFDRHFRAGKRPSVSVQAMTLIEIKSYTMAAGKRHGFLRIATRQVYPRRLAQEVTQKKRKVNLFGRLRAPIAP
jgi:hypothetical protein